MNRLYYGDNLKIMAEKMLKDSVDLIYLDPPFNSKKNYNLLYKKMTGKPVSEQVDAFCDTWEMDAQKEKAAEAMPLLMRQHGVEDYYVKFWRLWILALKNTQPHLLAYLIYMVERLLHMKTILKSSGSIYLHCDPTASHYIKVMMDGIFGHQNFRSEIIWKRTSSHNSAKRWGPVHDTILYYTKGDNYTWNRVAQPYDDSYIDAFYRHNDKTGRFRTGDLTGAGTRSGDSGKPWKGVDPTKTGRHWAVPAIPGLSKEEIKALTVQERLDRLDELGLIHWPSKGSIPQFRRYLDADKGVAAQDVITDIDPISPHAKEKLGYPTQKPISLLERIILASSDRGDVVFDPFCGCGTTVYAAERTSRTWIGCDIAILSINLITDVLTSDRFRLVNGKHFEVSGIPASVDGAQQLFTRDPFQFQHWLVERIGGFPTHKKVADSGIDGRIYFETKDGLKDMILSVKGGNVHPTDIRDLRGCLEREHGSEMAGFLSLKSPSKAMREEAASAGMYEYNGVQYERIQFLTVEQIMEEKRFFNTPSRIGTRVKSAQGSLPL
ncbi:MAG: site-specific DNA-methyltransferase [Acidobacteriota bacterium]